MADYACTVRTNYFHVNNPENFRKFMRGVSGYEDEVDLWEEKEKDGSTVFGFGCYGGIVGLCGDDEDDEDDDVDIDVAYDEFINGLQKFVTEDDAILIFESGNENLRYVTGLATIITRNAVETLSVEDLAKRRAAELLGNPAWKTRCDY